jgi:HK97 family phage portal protein
MSKNRAEGLLNAAGKLMEKAQMSMEEGLGSSDPSVYLPAMSMLQKAGYSSQAAEQKFDSDFPIAFQNLSSGYKDKPIMMSYHLLKGMSKEPIVNSVIRTRISQVTENFKFTYRDQDVTKGFGIRKKMRPGMKVVDRYNLSYDEEVEVYKLNKFLSNCGNRPDYEALAFDDWAKMSVRDSLIYDQWATEKVPDRLGRIHSFYPVDAKYIRISDSIDKDYFEEYSAQFTEAEKKKKNRRGVYPSYVQIVDQRVISSFYPEEMIFGVRNKTTDLESNGYGLSELEEMIAIITALLHTHTYNSNNFKNGALPKGFFKVAPGTSPARLEEFRQMWYNTLRGVLKSGSIPVLPSEKVEWVSMQENNKDMEFNAWEELNIKIACGLYLMDPAEINFPLSGDSGRHMFQNGTEARVEDSKGRGLNPLLTHFENHINKHIVSQYNDNYEIYFRGLEDMDPISQEGLIDKRIKTYWTVDEVRATKNMPPLPNGLGNTPLDSSFAAKLSALEAKQAMVDQASQPQPAPTPAIGKADDEGDDNEISRLWNEMIESY